MHIHNLKGIALDTLPVEIILLVLDFLDNQYSRLSVHMRRLRPSPVHSLSRVNRRLRGITKSHVFRRVSANSADQILEISACFPEHLAVYVRALSFTWSSNLYSQIYLLSVAQNFTSLVELNLRNTSGPPVNYTDIIVTVAYCVNLLALDMPGAQGPDVATPQWWITAKKFFPRLKRLRIFPLSGGWGSKLSWLLETISQTVEHLAIEVELDHDEEYQLDLRADSFFLSATFPKLKVAGLSQAVISIHTAFSFANRHRTLVEFNMATHHLISWAQLKGLMCGLLNRESLQYKEELQEDETPFIQSFAFTRRHPLNHPRCASTALDDVLEVALCLSSELGNYCHDSIARIISQMPNVEYVALSGRNLEKCCNVEKLLPLLQNSLKRLGHLTLALPLMLWGSPAFNDFPPLEEGSIGPDYESETDESEADEDGNDRSLTFTNSNSAPSAIQRWEHRHYQVLAGLVRRFATCSEALETFTIYPCEEGAIEGEQWPKWDWRITRRWNGWSSLSVQGNFIWREKDEHLNIFRVAVGEELRAWNQR